MSEETSASEIAKLIRDQLEQEQAVKASLESRAGSVVTSSGTLVTVLFALATLVTKQANYQLPALARAIIGGALAAFLAAAVLAIVVIRPRRYGIISVSSLQELTQADAWDSPAAIGAPNIARALVAVIAKAREENTSKGQFLVAAVTAEVVAVVLLGIAVGVILVTG